MIGPYQNVPAVCRDHDPRTAEVASQVAALIVPRLPGAVVEHVGSTSVAGCAGKGIVDLLLLYPDGQLAAARDLLDALGFQRQTGRDPFPEDRPMRVGSVEHDGAIFLLHVHVIAVASPEAGVIRAFRDRLRAEPGLVAEYVAVKKALLAAGVTDPVDYCNCKGEFITAALEQVKQTAADVLCRGEREQDREAIYRVHSLAFGQEEEARLVNALRDEGHARIGIVAEMAGEVVGHILFSRLPIVTADGVVESLALAPLAVLPEHQRHGIGSELVRQGLAACRSRGHRIVVVLGHTGFYPRFGFSSRLAESLANPFGRESFMAAELVPGALAGVVGRVEYPRPFGVGGEVGP
jgi:putative acetyltransferase